MLRFESQRELFKVKQMSSSIKLYSRIERDQA